ncbi:MAG: dicarboxylate/amino acid:cation symporter [Armatimonadetes bacterium]|nr:dicarboxylate/amino acid:cation symporter [Armatimonadota bacterium]
MPQKTPWYKVLYFQVLLAVALGILVGALWPSFGASLKPLGDGFVKLVKMMIAPIIFCTVVHGIASMGDLKKLGRIGGKTLLYFEVVSTFALVIGLAVVNILKPGVGFTPPGEVFHSVSKAAEGFVAKSHDMNSVDFFLKIIPDTFFSAFVSGELLQVLFVAILSAFAIVAMGVRGAPILSAIETVNEGFFGVMRILVRAAPVGAFGAMGFTVGNFGFAALGKLVLLMSGFYLTSALFVVVVLGLIARSVGFSIFRFIAYIKDELLLVLGTSSSETALPGMIEKMQRLGCAKSTVGLVIPTGYSFNLDGTNIYMAMAAVFLAQATNTPLSISQQIGLLLIAMVTSKGASGVTGAGFITLAATLQAVPAIPIGSLAILVGIDRFMSECRALTNLVGNGVATVVISRWEREVTPEELDANMRREVHVAPVLVSDEPEA